jgi:rare lipoprotein A
MDARALAVAVAAAGLLAGCARRNVKPEEEAPAARRQGRTASAGKADPKVRTRKDMPRGFVGEGLASFYGPGLHGRPTANGERFDQEASTAAHRTLKFGTCLRVVNMENGKAARVRVNDRGPFVEGRIIDVSKAVARKLEFLDDGVTRVRLYRCTDD